MPRNAETIEDPRRTLLGHLDAGQTGCISAASAAGNYHIYVMMGEVLAAHCEHDGSRIIELLQNAGGLPQSTIDGLRAAMNGTVPGFELLFEAVPEDVIMELLFERFRENVFQYLTAGRVIEFAPMETVFTENIQVGHDSRMLLDELTRVHAAVAGLLADDMLALAPGPREPESADQRRMRALVVEPVPLDDVLRRAPFEGSRALALVAGMIDEGMLLLVRTAPLPPDEPEESTEDAPTPSAAQVVRGAPNPAARMLPPIEDDELVAFQDYDTLRTGGDFSGTTLDRVEVVDRPLLAASTETLIEMEDAENAGPGSRAISLNFSGPKLQEDDALNKLGVVNEVLATICEAIGAVEGAGAGPARVQLLIEGMSGPLVSLFKNVEVEPGGTLPVDVILRNLRKRPVAEHRRLLNRGLADLIERALSMAFEALDEAALEVMLERIAGYQQRLGI